MTWASEDTVWRPLQPEGLAMALVAVCGLFGVLTTLVVGLRVYIRWKTRQFATDDWVIVAGYLFNVGQMIIAGYGGHTGLGTADNRLTLAQSIEGYKSIIIWQTFYSFSLVFIKSSICVTLLRITRDKRFKFILKLLIALSAGLSAIGIIVIFNQCHPMDRYWDKRVDGTCWPPIAATVLTYAASVFNVITDLTVATLPFFILKDVQMRPKLKLYIRLILALGLLAGVASIIRVPFTGAYMRDGDILYHVGHIVLWTIVECGLGIVAASLPMLRALFKRLAKDDSTTDGYRNDKKSGMNGTDLITIGGHYKGGGRHGGASRHTGYDTEIQVTVVGGPDNDSSSDLERGSSAHGHGDGDSTRQIIRVTRDIQQNSNPVDYYGSAHATDSLPRYHVNVGVGRSELPPAPPVYSGRPQGMNSYFSR